MRQISKDSKRLIKSATQYPATVVDIHGDRVSARLSGNGAIIHDIPIIGGPAEVGEAVSVDFTTPNPTAVATAKDWLSIEDILRALKKLPEPLIKDPITEFDKICCFCIDEPTIWYLFSPDVSGWYDAQEVLEADFLDLGYMRRWGIRIPSNFDPLFYSGIPPTGQSTTLECWYPQYIWGGGRESVHIHCDELYLSYGVILENLFFDFWWPVLRAYKDNSISSIGFAWADPPVPVIGNEIRTPANDYLFLPDQVFNGQLFRNCKFWAGCGEFEEGGDTAEAYNYAIIQIDPGELDAYYWTRDSDDLMIFENCDFWVDQDSCYRPAFVLHDGIGGYDDGYDTHIYLYDCTMDVGDDPVLPWAANVIKLYSTGTRFIGVPDILGISSYQTLKVSDRSPIDHIHTSGSSGGYDENALHDNELGEIYMVTEKTNPVGADILLLEDSEAAWAKKKVQIGNLPTSGSGTSGSGPEDFIDLGDTPSSYSGYGGKAVAVKNTVDGLEFIDFPTGGSGGGTPVLETVSGGSTDSHTGTGSWENITSGSAGITPSAAGRDLLCIFTFTIEPKSANWEHYKIRFLLDGSTASYEWVWERDSNPANNPKFVWTVHWVFENVDASEHTIQMQWHDNTTNQDVDFTLRKLTVIEAL